MERSNEETVTAATRAAEEEGGTSHLNWRSIFGGTFAALGVWLLLGALGVAIGLSAVSPEDPSLKGVALWLGVWSLVVPIIAMFLGTVVATRASGAVERTTGLLYGVVVWGVTTFIAAVFSYGMVSSVVSRTVNTATSLVQGVGSAAASAVQGAGAGGEGVMSAVSNFLNLDRGDLVAGLNQRLQQAGLPPVQPQQVQQALQQSVNTAVREGRFDANLFVNALVQETALSRQDVQQIAQQVQREWDQTVGSALNQLEQAAGSAANVALGAVDTIGKTFWWIFGSLALGLAAALGAGVWVSAKHGHTVERRQRARPLREAHAST
ncbi:MAG: hypothetical protein KA712_15855 [Myxococcales bacterium]|nr:hypothetical protein [Myxococcales bacterium]